MKVSKALGMCCLIEVHTEAELARVLQLEGLEDHLLGINNRDLGTFKVRLKPGPGCTCYIIDLNENTRRLHVLRYMMACFWPPLCLPLLPPLARACTLECDSAVLVLTPPPPRAPHCLRPSTCVQVDLAVTQHIMDSPSGQEVKRRSILMVGESGIFTPDDVAFVQNAGVGAILVGESLVKQGDPTAGVKQLLSLE